MQSLEILCNLAVQNYSLLCQIWLYRVLLLAGQLAPQNLLEEPVISTSLRKSSTCFCTCQCISCSMGFVYCGVGFFGWLAGLGVFCVVFPGRNYRLCICQNMGWISVSENTYNFWWLVFLGYTVQKIYYFYFLNHSNEEYLGYFNQIGFIWRNVSQKLFEWNYLIELFCVLGNVLWLQQDQLHLFAFWCRKPCQGIALHYAV